MTSFSTQSHPELMEEIYTAIVDSLSVKEQLIEGRTNEGN